MFKNLTQFTASDSHAAHWSLACVIIIIQNPSKNTFQLEIITSTLLKLTVVPIKVKYSYKSKIHFSDDDDQEKHFKTADTDGDGLLSADELKKFLIKSGVQPQDDIIQQMIEDVDSDGDGKINYAEYKILISGN